MYRDQLLRILIVIYVDETQYLVAGSSLDSDAAQHHFYVDDEYLDEPESASLRRSVSTSGNVPRDRQLDHSPSEVVLQKRMPDNISYSRLNALVVGGHSRSHAEHRSHGSDSEGLQTMQPSQQRLSLHVPPHRSVLTSHFYDAAALPLKDRTEAILFRHYIQKIAVCVSNKLAVRELASLNCTH